MASGTYEVGVVPISGTQVGIGIDVATAIIIPTTAQRAPIGIATPEFRGPRIAVMEMWLSVEAQDCRFRADGVAPTAALGIRVVAPTAGPIVFVGERMIRKLQFISVVAGSIINYEFFWRDLI